MYLFCVGNSKNTNSQILELKVKQRDEWLEAEKQAKKETEERWTEREKRIERLERDVDEKEEEMGRLKRDFEKVCEVGFVASTKPPLVKLAVKLL